MERLWRPWRMTYVGDPNPAGGCFLCDAVADASADEERLVIARTQHALAILNRYPYNTGHLMVAPARHVGDVGDLGPEEVSDVWSLMDGSISAIREAMRPDGFNIGMNLGKAAGAGLPGHLHVHVVPRWEGDANFMPIVAETKVLPQLLEDTCRSLRAILGLQGPSQGT